MAQRFWWAGGVGVALCAAALFLSTGPEYSSPGTVRIGTTTIQVEIVDTPQERALGLSGREHLFPNTGMLFVFPEDGRYHFWMKDMHFPIDIVWIAKDGAVIDIQSEVQPDSYPASFTSRRPARFVLELPVGFAQRHGLHGGDVISLPENLFVR